MVQFMVKVLYASLWIHVSSRFAVLHPSSQGSVWGTLEKDRLWAADHPAAGFVEVRHDQDRPLSQVSKYFIHSMYVGVPEKRQVDLTKKFDG